MLDILFLDIDGVLNSVVWFERLYKKRGFFKNDHKLDPKAVKNLVSILEKTGCKVVISSAMRILYSKEYMVRMMLRAGMPYRYMDRFIGITPIHHDRNRGNEIREYLSKNDVGRYVVIDDDSKDLVGLPLVKTRYSVGLRDKELVGEICSILM
jgi:hypothetical protein